MHLAQNIDIQGGLTGGLILGISSTVFLYASGKITGLSGIAEGLVKLTGEDWNWSYMAGLTFSGFVLTKLKPNAFGENFSELSQITLIVAGLLTGFGTRLSSGCTSGHGLCGLSRRSPRSLVAVLSFMFSGAVTAYFTRAPQHLRSHVYINKWYWPEGDNPILHWGPTVTVLALSLVSLYNQNKNKTLSEIVTSSVPSSSSVSMHLTSFASALLFGVGLGVSGMCNPERVLRFLDFSNPVTGFDPSLMCVMASGVVVNFLAFHYLHGSKATSVVNKVNLGSSLKMGLAKENLVIDWKLVIGSLIFGAGWGLAGACPGPAVVSLGASVATASIFVPSMFLGMKVKEWLI